MNRSVLNGGLLNGAVGFAAVLATVAIVCASSVSAAATRQQDALAPTASTAQVSANPTRTTFANASAVAGAANLFATPTHAQAAGAAVSTNASVVAYLLREIAAAALVQAGAQMTVIPASVIGGAAPAGNATVNVVGTRVQAGRTNYLSTAGVTIAPAPTAIRNARAQVQGSGTVRVEPGVNNVYDTFANLSGAASLVPNGVARRLPSASISASAEAQALGTRRQPGRVVLQPLTAQLEVVAFRLRPISTLMQGLVNVSAQGERYKLAAAQVTAAASITASSRQRHAAGATASATGNFAATVRRTTFAALSLQGAAQVTAAPVRNVRPVVTLAAPGAVVVQGLRTAYGAASAVATGQFVPVGKRTAYGLAAIGASAAVAPASATAIKVAGSAFAGAAELVANGLRRVIPDPVSMQTSGQMALTQAPVRILRPSSALEGAASVTCVAVRSLRPTADGFLNTAQTSASAVRNLIASVAPAQAGGALQAQARLAERGSASMAGEVNVTPEGVRVLRPSSAMTAQASVTAEGVRNLLPDAQIAATSSVTAQGVRVVRPLADVLPNLATLAVSGRRTTFGAVSVTPDQAQVTASALRTAFVTMAASGTAALAANIVVNKVAGAQMAGTASVAALALSNADSYDPADRTFYKAQMQTEFTHPFSSTEFRRPA